MKPASILVVDDDADTADSLVWILENAGYSAKAVYNAAAALTAAKETAPRLVFIDAAMPNMHGFALAKELRQLPGMADAVLVCFTGYTGAEYERQARDSGCDRFIIKPADPTHLLNIAREVTETGKLSELGENPA